MKTLVLRNIGPIRNAELTFGDLTLLVGPQATGKSIALQVQKLLLDKWQIHEQLKRYGIDWAGDSDRFLDTYFGEGMHAIWRSDSSLARDGRAVTIKQLATRRGRSPEAAFMIPAQRVLALRNGWPRPFTDFSVGDPFAVRDFSEKLRLLVEHEFNGSAELFPQPGRLKKEIREQLADHLFGKFSLRVDRVASQKRLVLRSDGDPLPHMVWSAGQREFVPLLLGLYWLMPPTRTAMRASIEWVILEEIEMGLHPRAINALLLLLLDLLDRGYRVCLSTHAPQLLEAAWAVRNLQDAGASPDDVLKMFAAPQTAPMRKLAKSVLEKTIKVYYFDRASGATSDISALDPDSEDATQSDWGGLAEFSARANRAVANAVARAGKHR